TFAIARFRDSEARNASPLPLREGAGGGGHSVPGVGAHRWFTRRRGVEVKGSTTEPQSMGRHFIRPLRRIQNGGPKGRPVIVLCDPSLCSLCLCGFTSFSVSSASSA